MLKEFFDEDKDLRDSPDNRAEYVNWALDNFNFVYRDPDHKVRSVFPYFIINY